MSCLQNTVNGKNKQHDSSLIIHILYNAQYKEKQKLYILYSLILVLPVCSTKCSASQLNLVHHDLRLICITYQIILD